MSMLVEDRKNRQFLGLMCRAPEVYTQALSACFSFPIIYGQTAPTAGFSRCTLTAPGVSENQRTVVLKHFSEFRFPGPFLS